MNRLRFLFSSDQLELLLAFEESDGLTSLAERLAKDPSVVSRNLLRLSEIAPVIDKVRNRWVLTEVGKNLNIASREFIDKVDQLTAQKNLNQTKTPEYASEHCALLIINAQKALLESKTGTRSNIDAEAKIEQILKRWRELQRPVIHVRHISDNPNSSFYKSKHGAEFIPELVPQGQELSLDKAKSSAFTDTELQRILTEKNIQSVLIVGFTANECIDATARQSTELGYHSFVAGDATATFDIQGPNGELFRADRVHQLTLANIHSFSAEVIDTELLLQKLQ